MTDHGDRWAEYLSRGAMAAAGNLGSGTIALEPGTRIDNPFGPKVLPMSPE